MRSTVGFAFFILSCLCGCSSFEEAETQRDVLPAADNVATSPADASGVRKPEDPDAPILQIASDNGSDDRMDEALLEALQLLLHTKTFEDAYVGYGAALSQGVQAFQVVLRQDNSTRLFTGLVDQAQVAGQLYGLCGLYLTDSALFQLRIQPFLQDSTEIDFFSGCVVRPVKVSDLCSSSDPDAIRLAADQSLSSWWSNHDRGVYDIVGGGLPRVFERAAGF